MGGDHRQEATCRDRLKSVRRGRREVRALHAEWERYEHRAEVATTVDRIVSHAAPRKPTRQKSRRQQKTLGLRNRKRVEEVVTSGGCVTLKRRESYGGRSDAVGSLGKVQR